MTPKTYPQLANHLFSQLLWEFKDIKYQKFFPVLSKFSLRHLSIFANGSFLVVSKDSYLLQHFVFHRWGTSSAYNNFIWAFTILSKQVQKPERAVIVIAQQDFYVCNIERKLQIWFEITLLNPWRTKLPLSTLSNVGYFNLSYMIIHCLTSRNFI